MARIGYPYLPPSEITGPLSAILRQIIDQLNSLSDGRLAAQTTAAAAVPTKGLYAQGDYVRNTKPTAGGPLGWVCVTATKADGTGTVWAPVNVN